MTVMAYVLRDSVTRLWGVSARERLKRQTNQIGGVTWPAQGSSPDAVDEIEGGGLLLLDATFLFEPRTLSELLDKPNSVLCLLEQPAAAFVDYNHFDAVKAYFDDPGVNNVPPRVQKLSCNDLRAFDDTLRRSEPPLLEVIDESQSQRLESTLYGNSYKGITDFVTKWVWPRPARRGVRVCADLGITPNMVTTLGFVLVFAAGYFFSKGYYATGLICGWIMTYLDTVDGKLARVTVQSSRVGHFFDHGVDLVHPPFWYYFWGISLTAFEPVFGLGISTMTIWIVSAYVIGRIAEGLFQLLGTCGVFTWRPFDAWVRLFTARRNPCLIILSVSVILGVPSWGFVGVFIWTVLSTLQLVARFVQGLLVRMTSGPLSSWLEDENAQEKHAKAYVVFGGTRAAYREVQN